MCKSFCLFDLKEDPCETEDIAQENSVVLEDLKKQLAQYWKELVPQGERTIDPNADPAYHNDLWTTWLDINENNEVIT